MVEENNAEVRNLEKNEKSLIDNNYKVALNTYYCKMVKQYFDNRSKSGIAVKIRDYELEKVKQKKLNLCIQIPDRKFEYMMIPYEKIESHIIEYEDRLYKSQHFENNFYKLILFEFIPNTHE